MIGRQAAVLVIAATAVAGIGATIVDPSPRRITYNPSRSAPRGFYALLPITPLSSLHRGDRLIAWPPAAAAQLADQRRYLPASVPLLKSVAAMPGAIVCRQGAAITINGRLLAIALGADRAARALPRWAGCARLRTGQVFLLGQSPDSYDGRYFGPSLREALIARARPLWTW